MVERRGVASAEETLAELRSLARPGSLEGMARYGIATDHALGVCIPDLRRVARRLGKDHALAASLWATEVHEARILAGLVEDPALVTAAQMDRWARDFDSWDLCDQVCSNLFDKTRLAHAKALAWSRRDPEFVKRAGFALMAAVAWHDREAPDEVFLDFLAAVEREATDPRNYVKKAVNWALRQIGKRSPALNAAAVQAAARMRETDSRPARWIAADALRELTSEAVLSRLAGAARGPRAAGARAGATSARRTRPRSASR